MKDKKENVKNDKIQKAVSFDDLKFDGGLIPAVVVDNSTGKVLTLAYMNRESLKKSVESGLTCFWSRSRQELWTKGETSGNYQHIVSITADCDLDALVVKVNKDGPACHTGSDGCFFNEIYRRESGDENKDFSVKELYDMIADRKRNGVVGSYTSYLFDSGIDKILKKVGEECTEVIVAAKNKDKSETIYEIADLVYHTLVLMVERGIQVDDITQELQKRHVIDKKVKQEKMASDKK